MTHQHGLGFGNQLGLHMNSFGALTVSSGGSRPSVCQCFGAISVACGPDLFLEPDFF
jgi:hypothetical protein